MPRTTIDTLYREAVDLADQARGWFDGPGVAWRARLPVAAQAAVATESLAITARLMAAMAWLLAPEHTLGTPVRGFDFDPGPGLPANTPLAAVPGGAIALASRDLVARLAALAPRPATAAAPAGDTATGGAGS